jgi:plastocyanin
MKTQYILVAVSCSALLFGAGCMSTSKPSVSPSPTVTNPSTSTMPVAAPATGTAPSAEVPVRPSIVISDFSFEPNMITIQAGTIVEWTNEDSVPHTITADDGAFDSGKIDKGATYPHLFSKPGTYAYHCSVHPSMKATIVVQ